MDRNPEPDEPSVPPESPVVALSSDDDDDFEHGAHTSNAREAYHFDPTTALDPPFLTNSEILARLSAEDLQLVDTFYDRCSQLKTAKQRHDLLKGELFKFLPIIRCPHCGSRVGANQLFQPKSGLFPSGFYMTCCYALAVEDKKRSYFGSANLGRLMIHPADCHELEPLKPRSGQRMDERQPRKKTRTEGRTLAHYSPDRTAAPPVPVSDLTDPQQPDRITQLERGFKELQEQLALVLKGLTQLLAAETKDGQSPREVIAHVQALSHKANEMAQTVRETKPAEIPKPAKGKPTFAEVVRKSSPNTAHLPRMKPPPALQKLSVQGNLPAPQARPTPIPDLASGGGLRALTSETMPEAFRWRPRMAEVFMEVPFSMEDYPLGRFRSDLTKAIGCGDTYLKNVRKLRRNTVALLVPEREQEELSNLLRRKKTVAGGPLRVRLLRDPLFAPNSTAEDRYYEARRCSREMDRLTKLKFVSAADYFSRRMKEVAERTGISIVKETPEISQVLPAETPEDLHPTTADVPEAL
ncbi:MAG: hypothetical protein KVP17_003521 [Porospora cf. gigantea B]|nr:MAG: hypothetical protein KVP17_003521 [Porospora cf. gigantea B]